MKWPRKLDADSCNPVPIAIEAQHVEDVERILDRIRGRVLDVDKGERYSLVDVSCSRYQRDY